MDISAFFKLSYGVFIVATGHEKKNGFAATTAIQVTSEPNQLLVACNKKNYSAQLIQECKAYSVSVFRQAFTPKTLGNFGFRSGRDIDKFQQCNYVIGKETGVPIVLDDAVAWFECRLVNTFDAGTHLLFIGEVVDAAVLDPTATPLTYAYYHEVKKGTTPANAPHASAKNK